jgi:outer membrane protein TolC
LIVILVSWNALPASAQIGVPVADAPGGQVRRLTVDVAVRLAGGNNLGIQIARINPLIEDLTVAVARSAWTPTFNTTMQGASTDLPNNSFLSGTLSDKTTNGRAASNVGVTQQTKWGGTYSVGWDSARSTTTNLFSNFSPQLQSSLSIDIRPCA